MKIDQMFSTGDLGDFSGNLRGSLEYTMAIFRNSTLEGELKSTAAIRNGEWREQFQDMTTSQTYLVDGKLNNAFYRTKFYFDIVVPYKVYEPIMDYYLTSIRDGVGEEIKFIEKNIDHILTFCYIISCNHGKFISNIESKQGKLPMARDLIYSYVGREFRKVRAFLEMLGIIHVDHSYIATNMLDPGSDQQAYCKHYEFAVNLDGRFVTHQVSKRTIVSKMHGMMIAETSEEVISEEIDESNVINDPYLNKLFSSRARLSHGAIEHRDLDYEGTANYYSKVNRSGQAFRNFVIGRDRFGRRLYNPFLLINKKLRQFVEIDGDPDTVETDINNSHPYFISLFMDEKFLEFIKPVLRSDEYGLFKTVRSMPEYRDQILLFKNVVSSGTYYSFLADNIYGHFTIDEIKTMNMYFLYGKINSRNVIFKFFKKHFSFVNFIKSRIFQIGGKNRLCQLLQQVESYVMIDKVFYNILKSGKFAIPLHDAFLSRRCDRDFVIKAMTDVFSDIGVEYMPTFNKAADRARVDAVYKEIKRKHFNRFLNRNLMFEEINKLLPQMGIKNRVFKEDMKQKTLDYIERKVEENRHRIDPVVLEKYYEIREAIDDKDYKFEDFTQMFDEFDNEEKYKKKYFSKRVFEYVKINPIEYVNSKLGLSIKSRLNENKYIY